MFHLAVSRGKFLAAAVRERRWERYKKAGGKIPPAFEVIFKCISVLVVHTAHSTHAAHAFHSAHAAHGVFLFRFVGYQRVCCEDHGSD